MARISFIFRYLLTTPPFALGWGQAGAMALALVPLFIIALHATPQLFDFCTGSFLHDGFWQGLVNQFNIYGHQFMGRTLAMLPITITATLAVDYFYVYALFSLLALLGFIILARRVVHELLPAARPASNLFAVVLLTLALVANAPSTRELVFNLPAFFTYALPGLVMAMMFMMLYHSLAAQRAFTWQEHAVILGGACFVALSNEWSGVALIGLLLCSFLARLRLVPDAPEPITHAAALCLSLFGAVLILLGPSDPIFTFEHLGMGVAWGLLFTPEFFALRLPLPGIIAWLMFLGFCYRPELRGSTLSTRHRQLASFVFFSLFIISFVAFIFGYLPHQSRLPARGQNQLYVLVLVALSILFCLVLPVLRYRLQTTTNRLPSWLTDIPPLPVIMLLALLSPAWLAAVTQLNDTRTFRAEQRARFALLLDRAEPTVFLPALTVQPSLLADRDISDNPANWSNACIAAFFKADKVMPQPDKL